MKVKRSYVGYLLVAFILCVATACADTSRDRVVVLAASSLSDAFQEMELAFEAVNPTIDVQLNLAGSSSLREQIFDGAPADVFASASELTMQQVVAKVGVAREAQPFATNALTIVTPAENPAEITEIRDLARDDILVGLCAAEVPCGMFARDALAQAGVQASIDTDEPNVRSLLGKIIAGELDAGIVYTSDVSGPARQPESLQPQTMQPQTMQPQTMQPQTMQPQTMQVQTIALPDNVDVEIVYPIAELNEAANSSGAQAFVSFVLSTEGQSILATYGFGSP